jgi:hypothetical protein
MFTFKNIDNWFTDEERLNIRNKVEDLKSEENGVATDDVKEIFN